MRLEHIFDIEMGYVGEPVSLEPYGGKETIFFGELEGVLKGPKLKGSLRWANHARRREDGVWCPHVHGVVTTEEGAKILMTMKGYNVLEKAPSTKSAITAVCTFGASDEKYRWLNSVIAVVEGVRDRQANRVRLKGYSCVNELAGTIQNMPAGIARSG